MTPPRVRVLLVDDHAMFRQGLRSALQIYPGIEVVGEASNGEEAIVSAGQCDPAVVVMDINMPRVDGISATQQITTQFPQVAVVGLSDDEDTYFLSAMRKAGAFDVLAKEMTLHELSRAIRKAAASLEPAKDAAQEADAVYQVG